jgi:glycerol-3-phosphate acyltransferase PlsY
MSPEIVPILFLAVAWALFGYLCGSVSTAIIVCKLMSLPSPYSVGSGNPGATNVLRIGGKWAAIITLLGDALKGLLPVLLAYACLGSLDATLSARVSGWLPALAGFSAFVGHLYPVFFGFKGGKGVATAFGALAGISWPVCLMTALTWALVAAISRYSALAALTAFALAPVYAFFWTGGLFMTVLLVIMSVMIFWRHQDNIKRLLDGTEGRFGKN